MPKKRTTTKPKAAQPEAKTNVPQLDGTEQIVEPQGKIINSLAYPVYDPNKPHPAISCPYCMGSGKTYGWECPACKGHKIVDPDTFKYVEGLESR